MENNKTKNYTFNNCTVTINEEGKAIDILQKKIESDIRQQESFMGIATIVVSTLTKVAEKWNESENKSGAKPVTKTRKKPTNKK